jgi:hypothetical protein
VKVTIDPTRLVMVYGQTKFIGSTMCGFVFEFFIFVIAITGSHYFDVLCLLSNISLVVHDDRFC